MLITNAFRLGDVFVIFFLRAEDCAEGLPYRLHLLSHGVIGLAIAEDVEYAVN